MNLSLEDIEDLKIQIDNFEKVCNLLCNFDDIRYSSPYKKKKIRKKKLKVYFKNKKRRKK
jgi:hypothetical protein